MGHILIMNVVGMFEVQAGCSSKGVISRVIWSLDLAGMAGNWLVLEYCPASHGAAVDGSYPA